MRRSPLALTAALTAALALLAVGAARPAEAASGPLGRVSQVLAVASGGQVREIQGSLGAGDPAGHGGVQIGHLGDDDNAADRVPERRAAGRVPGRDALTQVTSFGSNPGALAMYTYTPPNLPTDAPLVVALHGCSQSASDYFTHSGWAELADRYGFAVAFPQQSSSNNYLTCFDWYTPSDDARGAGEAASVLSMVDYEKTHQSIDAARVYVTGLSAGGAMTADLLADYPDVFAGGATDSGIAAQCATSITQASSCQYSSQGLTPAQWAAKVTASDPGYTGAYPRVAIWQGTADYVVYPVNATELRDQWTAVHGVSQTPSSTRTLTGGTTEQTYDDSSGNPVVASFSVARMGHGTAVHPGSGPTDCGTTGTYYPNYICSSYYTAQFWGLTG